MSDPAAQRAQQRSKVLSQALEISGGICLITYFAAYILHLPWFVNVAGAVPLFVVSTIAMFIRARQMEWRFCVYPLLLLEASLAIAGIGVITSPDTSIADLGNKIFFGSIAAFMITLLVNVSAAYVLNTPKAWRNRGQAGVMQLISEVEHGQREDRVAAAKILGKLGDAQAVETLIQALHDPDRSVCLSAARTLGRLGDPALEPLRHALQDKDSQVRLGAALALRASGDERAVEPLRQALSDPEGTVRAVAVWAMGEFRKTSKPYQYCYRCSRMTPRLTMRAIWLKTRRVMRSDVSDGLNTISSYPITRKERTVSNSIAIQAIHHIRLTVTNVVRSQEFYTQVLGFQVAREIPTGVLLTQGSFLLGLGPAFDPASAPPDDRFSEHRVGLDHLSFSVGSQSDLEAAVQLFDAHGISHGEIEDIGRFYVLAFRDPDNIQLELTAPHS